jgi:CO dehydrogenase/acetyl-CoA synthase epsilon subunit
MIGKEGYYINKYVAILKNMSNNIVSIIITETDGEA